MMICEVNMIIEPRVESFILNSIQSYARHVTDHSGSLYSRIQRNQELPQQITLYFAFKNQDTLSKFLANHKTCLPSDILQRHGSQVAANRRVFEVTKEYIAA